MLHRYLEEYLPEEPLDEIALTQILNSNENVFRKSQDNQLWTFRGFE
jgi:hypothetical protein